MPRSCAAGPDRFDHAIAADHDAVGLDREGLRRIGEERIVAAGHDRAAQRRDAVSPGMQASRFLRDYAGGVRERRALFAAAAALSVDRAARQRLFSGHVALAPMRCPRRRLCGGAATGSVRIRGGCAARARRRSRLRDLPWRQFRARRAGGAGSMQRVPRALRGSRRGPGARGAPVRVAARRHVICAFIRARRCSVRRDADPRTFSACAAALADPQSGQSIRRVLARSNIMELSMKLSFVVRTRPCARHRRGRPRLQGRRAGDRPSVVARDARRAPPSPAAT